MPWNLQSLIFLLLHIEMNLSWDALFCQYLPHFPRGGQGIVVTITRYGLILGNFEAYFWRLMFTLPRECM